MLHSVRVHGFRIVRIFTYRIIASPRRRVFAAKVRLGPKICMRIKKEEGSEIEEDPHRKDAHVKIIIHNHKTRLGNGLGLDRSAGRAL